MAGLRLQDSCWYVGFSADPETRTASHFLGRGARWTQLHPPLAVESLQPGDENLENVVTIALMAKHGFQLVRGGRYVAGDMPLPPPPIVKAYSIIPSAPVHAETVAEAVGRPSKTIEFKYEQLLRLLCLHLFFKSYVS